MKLHIICLYLFICAIFSCTKFVQVSPPTTELVGTTVYQTDATAAAALAGIYQTMMNNSIGGGFGGISILTGLSADEVSLYPGTAVLFQQIYTNSLVSSDPPTFWGDLYNCLYQANYAIEQLSSSSSLTSSLKTQLMGQAKFIRAFCFFYLTQIYGDVPLVTSSAYQINGGLTRTPKAEVIAQVISDLSSAQDLVNDTYLTVNGTGTMQRIIPNRSAISAMLARVYLYNQKWDSAYMESSMVINDGQYAMCSSLDSVFLANSQETIWALQPNNSGYNTPDAQAFLLGSFNSGGPNVGVPFYLNNNLVNAFDSNDQRRVFWIDSVIANGITYYYPYKYTALFTGTTMMPVQYVVVLRLAEQYLIRAETEINGAGSGLSGALSDLDTVRRRAGLANYSGPTDLTSVVQAIIHERQVELFTEYGHRWFDLQRTGMIDSVMGPVCAQKGGSWSPNWALYPIPLTEIQADSKLSQNNGY
jgi:starch-binding outer membrane protein, SusD/RagB family